MVIWIVLTVFLILIFIAFIGYTFIAKFKNYQKLAVEQIVNTFIEIGVPDYEFINPDLEKELFKKVRKEVSSIKNNYGLARNNRDWEEQRVKKNCFSIVCEIYERDSGISVKSGLNKKPIPPTRSQIIGDETISLEERNRLIRELEREITRNETS
ncbi:hypothetical protein [Spiroplasma endosymbiont of Panorpa germanica]|uniref:hypothetical protein n=1 Tax=Spiroplasma endosymbiont of Panorpa germanica TaxID=3066314 RepID=UPI0030CD0E94